jgi:hypothetical protein
VWLVQLSSSCGAPGGRAAHQQHCTSIGLWWRAAWPRGRCACWPVGECLAWWMPAGGGCCILRRLQLAQTSRQVESRERRISVCFELPTRAERETLRRPDGSDVADGKACKFGLAWSGTRCGCRCVCQCEWRFLLAVRTGAGVGIAEPERAARCRKRHGRKAAGGSANAERGGTAAR